MTLLSARRFQFALFGSPFRVLSPSVSPTRLHTSYIRCRARPIAAGTGDHVWPTPGGRAAATTRRADGGLELVHPAIDPILQRAVNARHQIRDDVVEGTADAGA